MNRLLYGGAFFALAASAAIAQTTAAAPIVDTVVNVPWGDWLSAAADNIVVIVVAVVGWALRKLPSHIVAMIKTAQVDQLLYKAIDAAINRTAGAAKGEALSFKVSNEVLAKALQYAIDNAPKWMISWSGGVDGLRDKIVARLNVSKDAAV